MNTPAGIAGSAVRLETARLILDAHLAADHEAIASLWSDPLIVRHISGRPSTAQDSWMRLLRYGGLWPLLGYGYWAVRDRATGRYAGEVGFADFHRDCQPPIRGIPEAGWVIASWAQGRGFASEALGAALAWLDTVPGFTRSCCLIDPDNTVSIHLAQKHGYANCTTLRFNGADCLLFFRARPDNSGPTAMTLTIAPADLLDPRIIEVLETHARTARAETARGSAHALDLSGLQAPGIQVWAAWREGAPVGVGALKPLSVTDAELKAMHTISAARRGGVGRAILGHIIAAARAAGFRRLYLETGSWPYFAPARALYAAGGFVECPPFGDYRADPNSIFMSLDIGA
jgi:RimJ/RimL family protein N-acetyltransferase/ribosomal protein S18 acetylase RimI-like enzyme